ncbi:hypothetical protein ROHU_021179 [Labeo rohita]|uniref:Uncharacterized protein n=1 Tax=Labeo rohita TaxID=84645 RepID=A0A498N202_LABRO|nr:hypothetical protein ROHU_021179 [Labeo rohita]
MGTEVGPAEQGELGTTTAEQTRPKIPTAEQMEQEPSRVAQTEQMPSSGSRDSGFSHSKHRAKQDTADLGGLQILVAILGRDSGLAAMTGQDSGMAVTVGPGHDRQDKEFTSGRHCLESLRSRTPLTRKALAAILGRDSGLVTMKETLKRFWNGGSATM